MAMQEYKAINFKSATYKLIAIINSIIEEYREVLQAHYRHCQRRQDGGDDRLGCH